MNTEEKLKQLRQEWLKADNSDRKIIEMRAKLLKIGKKQNETSTTLTTNEITNIFNS